MVLHTCPRTIREERLLARGWDNSDFANIENWSQILLEESQESSALIVDSSVQSTEQISKGISKHLEDAS